MSLLSFMKLLNPSYPPFACVRVTSKKRGTPGVPLGGEKGGMRHDQRWVGSPLWQRGGRGDLYVRLSYVLNYEKNNNIRDALIKSCIHCEPFDRLRANGLNQCFLCVLYRLAVIARHPVCVLVTVGNLICRSSCDFP